MQVLVSATSSKVDDLILIETSTTIGDQTTTSRVGYNVEELMENRFLSGDLETRIEALRVGAEKMTTKGVELHFKTLMKILHKEPEVTEVTTTPTGRVVPEFNPVIQQLPGEKKTRAKRTTKTTTESK